MIANSADDEYYQRYKFISTLYRLCAWLGWVELYRQEVAFLDSGQQKTNGAFERDLDAIRSSLADGHLNEAEDWLECMRKRNRTLTPAVGATVAGRPRRQG